MFPYEVTPTMLSSAFRLHASRCTSLNLTRYLPLRRTRNQNLGLATSVTPFSTPNPLAFKFVVEDLDLPLDPAHDTAVDANTGTKGLSTRTYTMNLSGVKGGGMQEYHRSSYANKTTLLGLGLGLEPNRAENARVLPKELLEHYPQLTRVNVADDFVTCTVGEEAEIDWDEVAREIEHILSSNPMVFVVEGAVASDDSIYTGTEAGGMLSELDREIIELLEANVRPNLKLDGGDVIYKGFEEETGKVKLRLIGACVGCPSSTVTLNFMISNLLVHTFEEVTGVKQIFEDEDIVNPNDSSTWTG